MNKKSICLAAACTEILRFFALNFVAGGFASFSSGGLGQVVFRYVAIPQLLLAAAFFFLWFDGEHYAPFRPLLIVGKATSLIVGLALPVSVLYGNDPGLSLSVNPVVTVALAFALPLFDLFGLVAATLSVPARAPDKPSVPPSDAPEMVGTGDESAGTSPKESE